jgi:hypothetical protein
MLKPMLENLNPYLFPLKVLQPLRMTGVVQQQQQVANVSESKFMR